MCRAGLLLVFVILFAGCPSRPDGATGASSSSAAPAPGTGSPGDAGSASLPDDPRWLSAALRAPPPLAQAARDARRAPRPRAPKSPAAVDAVLDEVAQQSASAAGLRKAAQLLHEGAPKLADPSWAGSGTAPWAMWLHAGGIAILADLAQRACAASPGADKDVLKAIDEIELPPIFNSGGVDRAAMDVQRGRLRAAASGCAAK